MEQPTPDQISRRVLRHHWEPAKGVRGTLLVVEEDSSASPKFLCDLLNEGLLRVCKVSRGKGTGIQWKEFVMLLMSFLSGYLQFNFSWDSASQRHWRHFLSLFHEHNGFCELAQTEPIDGCADALLKEAFKDLSGTSESVVFANPKEKRRVAGVLDSVARIQRILLLDPNVMAWKGQQDEDARPLDDFTLAASGTCDNNCDWLEKLVKHWRWELGPCRVLNRILKTSRVSGARLLYDLRESFAADSFQSEYNALRNTASGSLSYSDSHVQAVNMSFAVQSRVLPKHGFAASPAGVKNLRTEIHWHNDPVLGYLADDIHKLLDTSPHQRSVAKYVAKPRASNFHTIGDSHAGNGWPPDIIQHYVGSKLCYNVNHVSVQTLQTFEPPVCQGDALCFCFGEIDCRAHVHKHCSADRTYKQVIDEIVFRYFRYLTETIPLLPPDLKIFVYNVVPPIREVLMYHRDGLLALQYGGSDEERLAYVQYFNTRLKMECTSCCYTFFDVYDKYADAEGFMRMEYSDGGVHVAESCFLQDFIHQHLELG
eukprot:TRINITY_DN24822_c0_g1_i1.p1 TRINITY_DN24822_c0_g1~~TRINITY_DN24822_c0_g1_i1.p1  ORF type:complete len:539 (-),score=60.06 TRINITY_DN24822_c0_g1_i1:342-1958(-)